MLEKSRILLLIAGLLLSHSDLFAQLEKIVIRGNIVGNITLGKEYAYAITGGNDQSEFHKAAIKNGRFQILLNKSLKDTILRSLIFLSKFPLMDQATYEKELKAKRIDGRKDLFFFMIDSTAVDLKIDPSNHKIIVSGGRVNKEQALYDSLEVDYYEIVKKEGTEYANKKRILATLKIISDHHSSLLAAENLRGLIMLPLPGGAYPYRNEIDVTLASLNSKAIGEKRIENMRILYNKMVKRYTPKSNVLFPAIDFFNLKSATFSLVDIADGSEFILIDFWATWCGPCLQQHPQLKSIQKKYKNNKKIKIIGVSVDQTIKPWQGYLNANPFTYGQYWVNPEANQILKEELGLEAIPAYVLINAKTGIVTDLNIGINDIIAKFKEKGISSDPEKVPLHLGPGD